jgi:PAS domain S-box-containing protein
MDLQSLRILMVEDSPADAELLVRELRGLGRPFEHRRVAFAEALRQALDEFEPHIVLSDYSMPGFGGADALQIVMERAKDTPFVYVSGTLGEERAIEALQRGAWDYVLKENLRRLPAAVDRALRMAQERRERAEAQQALAESEERFRSIVESSQDLIIEVDPDFTITYANPASEDVIGYAPEELAGTPVLPYLTEDAVREVEEKLGGYVEQHRSWSRWRLRWHHRDGGTRMLEGSGMPLYAADGTLAGYRSVNHDITLVIEQRERIEQLARIRAVLGEVGNSVMRSADRKSLLLNACRVAVEQGGFKAAGIAERGPRDALQVVSTFGDRALLGSVNPAETMGTDPSSPYYDHPSIVAFREQRVVVIEDYETADVPEGLRRLMLANGVRSQVSLPLGPAPWGVFALYSDRARSNTPDELALLGRLADDIDRAIEFIGKSERLEYLAFHNPLTGLPNRVAFQGQLQELLASGGQVVVAACNVQRMGRINSSRGRNFGDALLRQIGLRLERQPYAEFLVAHPEGDTFLLAYPANGTLDGECDDLDERLRLMGQAPFQVNNEHVYVSLRAGLALGPFQGDTAESLERNAMSALAGAREHRVHVKAYNADLRRVAMQRIELEHDLRRAIDDEQFELYYQPKYDAHSRRLVGAEAVIRWHHPGNGMVSPDIFVPVLEDPGLVVPVGHWVMREALAMALTWRQFQPDLRIAVNISAREMRSATFLEECIEMLALHSTDQPLDIEVTESVLMESVDQSIRVLEGLRDLGCRVAIDDFGTGYSSLNYLVRLPVDFVKIDRSFVSTLTQSPEIVALVNHMITLSHSLSLKVVAEGVEEEEQAKLLRLLRCDQLQGYLFGRPMPASQFARDVLGLLAEDD